MRASKIVISSMAELEVWRDVIKAYEPADKTERKVWRILVRNARCGYEKRLNII